MSLSNITIDNFLQGGSPSDFFRREVADDDDGLTKPQPIPGYIWAPTFNARGDQDGWTLEIDRTFRAAGTGTGARAPTFRPGELALLQAELAEQKRSNIAREAASTRQITLDRALGSLTAYNTAQDIANQRRLTAFDQARQLAGFLIPKGTEFFPGLEPDSALAQVSQDFGLPFGGAPVVEQTFDVGALSQPGQISPQVTEMLAGLGGI